MPSVCNGHAPVVAAEGAEFSVAKLIVSHIEKKYRNLDKRKAKLDGYHQKEKEGEKLNKDQKDALLYRGHVAHTVETLKELLDQVTTVAAEEEKKNEKLLKKQAKRQQIEAHKERVNLIFEMLRLQQVLKSVEDMNTKPNAAVVLTEEELLQLEKLRGLIMPPPRSVMVSLEKTELATSYLEGKEGEYAGCSFQVLRGVVKRVAEGSCVATGDADEKTDVCEVKEEKLEEAKVEVQPIVEPVEEKRDNEEVQPVPCIPVQREVDSQPPSTTDAPITIEVPASRTAKKPQEFLSSFCGNYNFLQESEIDENEQVVPTTVAPVSKFYDPHAYDSSTDFVIPQSLDGVLNDKAVLYVSEALPTTVAPVSGMYSPYAYVACTDYAVPHSHAPMVGGMMPAQPVPFTAYENQQAMYVPVGYAEHMPAGYTMAGSYAAPVVSHEQCIMQEIPNTEPSDFEASAVAPELVMESTSPEADETQEESTGGEFASTAGPVEPQRTFSMNPNADVFHSKNFPEGAGMMLENSQGDYCGKSRGRGGRGNPGGYQGRGHRGGNYNGRGGGYPRYQRNDGYRPEGQNGYSAECNNGWRGPRRGIRGGSGRGGGYARGGRGSYDHSSAPQTSPPETQN